jgi:TolB-like protein/Flp pilus assembly protein TadD
MASLIHGYNYDIFISYRQKDNRGERWVSEFVDALRDELESTFKEEISVYFDINPHDGLLETHDVGASLKEKLKCLVFIPVISQTYCDPKCFAWQYEFAAFNKIAKEDQFGRDIRLAGGNVASRILPVKIHDLDQEDKALLENELGGMLRSIEFIFKSAGVNRPLKPSDNPDKNLNKTYYRDQINKVANAIKEIISAIRKQGQPAEEIRSVFPKAKNTPPGKYKNGIILGSLLILALFTIGYFSLPELLKSAGEPKKSIAVLPLEYRSENQEYAWFGDELTGEIIQQLYKIKEFSVRPRLSVMQYKQTTKSTISIGKELKVNYLIAGSAERTIDSVIIKVQLINALSDIQIWAETFKENLKNISSIQTEIAKQIADKLKIALSPEEIIQIDKKSTDNPEAMDYYLLGNNFYQRGFTKENIGNAANMYRSAIDLDPGFAMAYVRLSLCYSSLHWFDFNPDIDRLGKSKEAIDKAFKIDHDLPQAHLALGFYYYWGFLNYTRAIEEVTIAQQQLPNNGECFYAKANIYRRAGEWSLSQENFMKAIELDPTNSLTVFNASETLALQCDYLEAEKLYNKAILLNPTLIEAVWQKSFMYLKWKGNTLQARETINEAFKYPVCSSNNILSEFDVLLDIYDGDYRKALANLSSKHYDIIIYHLYIGSKDLLFGRIYSLLNMADSSKKYYRSALTKLDSMQRKNSEDPRLYSAIGYAYAGLGLKEEAISAGMKATDKMKLEKEAYRGASRAEDLARIYVMTGEYDLAMEQIRILLNVPSRISAKLLLLDPAWKPLMNLPEFKKIINSTNPDGKFN